MDKLKIVILCLAISVFLLGQYVILEKWIDTSFEERTMIFQEGFANGYDKGLTDIVTTIFYNLQGCTPTDISLHNDTKYIIDVSCLNSEN